MRQPSRLHSLVSNLACDEQALCLELLVPRLLVDALLLQPAQLFLGEGVGQLALEQRLHQQLLVGRVHASFGLAAVTKPIPKRLKKYSSEKYKGNKKKRGYWQ